MTEDSTSVRRRRLTVKTTELPTIATDEDNEDQDNHGKRQKVCGPPGTASSKVILIDDGDALMHDTTQAAKQGEDVEKVAASHDDVTKEKWSGSAPSGQRNDSGQQTVLQTVTMGATGMPGDNVEGLDGEEKDKSHDGREAEPYNPDAKVKREVKTEVAQDSEGQKDGEKQVSGGKKHEGGAVLDTVDEQEEDALLTKTDEAVGGEDSEDYQEQAEEEHPLEEDGEVEVVDDEGLHPDPGKPSILRQVVDVGHLFLFFNESY